MDEEFLFIAYAARLQLGGGIGVLGMNSDHDIHSVYELSEYSPSFVTAKSLGLAVRTSAFPQKCDPGDIVPACPRNYLYLVWKHHEIPYQVSLSQPFYTAVLQNADPDEYWFTRPVKSLYSTRTGVSWNLGERT